MADRRSPYQRGPQAPKALIDAVLEKSVADTWANAVREWYVVGVDEDEDATGKCVCGKEGLRYLFEIRNRHNGNTIWPIGSKCIEKFEDQDMNTDVKCWLGVLKLVDRAVRYGRRRHISLFEDKKLFSRRLIWFMYEQGVFEPDRYNGFDPRNDAEFLVDMFNKHDPPTKSQRKKAQAIIDKRVYPFLRQTYVEAHAW